MGSFVSPQSIRLHIEFSRSLSQFEPPAREDKTSPGKEAVREVIQEVQNEDLADWLFPPLPTTVSRKGNQWLCTEKDLWCSVRRAPQEDWWKPFWVFGMSLHNPSDWKLSGLVCPVPDSPPLK